jgi:hypothetical protein
MPAKPEKPFNIIFEGEWNDIPCADYPLTPERWVEEIPCIYHGAGLPHGRPRGLDCLTELC